ncbi:hypothetical protein [Alloyangia pacifica]|uniref:hypothetical protein n=1 Tax=Alloyangia pacifica TaxID=311180 RepID=UPI00131EFB6D|nr:hypothetical protein [Alloyangia pacifica]
MKYLFAHREDAEAINAYANSCRAHKTIWVTCLYRRTLADVVYDWKPLCKADEDNLCAHKQQVVDLFERLLSRQEAGTVYKYAAPERFELKNMPIPQAKAAAEELHMLMTQLIEELRGGPVPLAN